jgi:hypothetical protein
METYVALAADGLLAVVLGGKSLQGGLNDTTTETEDKMKSGLLLKNHPSTYILISSFSNANHKSAHHESSRTFWML